jgi:hypothetical protein
LPLLNIFLLNEQFLAWTFHHLDTLSSRDDQCVAFVPRQLSMLLSNLCSLLLDQFLVWLHYVGQDEKCVSDEDKNIGDWG